MVYDDNYIHTYDETFADLLKRNVELMHGRKVENLWLLCTE